MTARGRMYVLSLAVLAVLIPSLVHGNIDKSSDYLAKSVRFLQHVRQSATADQNSNEQAAILASDLRNSLPFTKADVRALAEASLADGFAALSNSSYDVSPRCLNDTELLLAGLVNTELWALRMLDAVGKPPSGLMDYQLMWLGSYDECVAVKAVVYGDPVNKTDPLSYPYKGRYCKASFVIEPGQPTLTSPGGLALTIGLCVPNTCNSQDVTALVNTGIYALPINTSSLPEPAVTCQLESLDLDSKAIVAIVICSVVAAFMLLGTTYDILFVQCHVTETVQNIQSRAGGYRKYSSSEEETNNQATQYGSVAQTGDSPTSPEYGNAIGEGANGHLLAKRNQTKDLHGPTVKDGQDRNSYSPGRFGKVLLAFSVYTNASKILNTSQPAGTLSAVNGIRFLSMSWVILGHTYVFLMGVGDNLPTFFPTMVSRWTFEAVANATFSVDSFFVLSGLLVAYLALKEMKKAGGAGRFNWGMYYFHRFWRLTPAYMLFMMFYVTLMKYWSNGPLWNQSGVEPNNCRTWWRNLLYINNLFNDVDICMGWTWYLSNDMQFYVLSPLMLIPFYYSSVFGGFVCLAFLLICFISSGVISAANNFTANMLAETNATEFQIDMYFKPYTRIGPYVIGVMAGYLLYKTECKIRMPKLLNLLGWAVAAAIALSVLYGLYDPDDNTKSNLSTDLSAFYNATSRTAWGIALAWVIVACATGNGGFVNRLLSWKAFVPLARLTYCAYLVHPIVIYVYAMTRSTLIHFYDLEIIYLFVGNMFLSYAVAFCVSLAFEAPMMGLEKVLLGRGKNS